MASMLRDSLQVSTQLSRHLTMIYEDVLWKRMPAPDRPAVIGRWLDRERTLALDTFQA
jgi:hypothetical protein